MHLMDVNAPHAKEKAQTGPTPYSCSCSSRYGAGVRNRTTRPPNRPRISAVAF